MPRFGVEYLRYRLAERITRLIYPKYKFSDFGRTFLEDEAFISTYKRLVGANSFGSLDRKYVLCELLKLTLQVEGDTAECGCYTGTGTYLICKTVAGTGKRHHVFDSFEGLSNPTIEDGKAWIKGNLRCDETTVRERLKEFDFVAYHKGWIPQKFTDVQDRRFSFVHIDVDLYQPTYDSVKFFYPRMSKGGIILSDDYGFKQCPGVKRALDHFLADKPQSLVRLPTGQAFVIV